MAARNLRSIYTEREYVPPPANRQDPRWSASWRHLFARYTPAMVRYVRALLSRTKGYMATDEEAEDVVQSYLTACVEKGWLSRDGNQVRCFRAYLQTQLRRFVYDYLDHRLAKKRKSPGDESPEVLAHVAGDSLQDAIEELDRGWVQVAADEALERLRQSHYAYYEAIMDLLRTDGEGSPDFGAQVGRTGRQLDDLRYRARRRFATLFHDELRGAVRDEAALKALIVRLDPLVS